MTETRQFVMPWPPSLNRIYRAVRQGGHATIKLSKLAREYQAAAVRALPVGRQPKPMAGRLLVWLTLRPPAKLVGKPFDIANREKLLVDCLTHQRVWLDDSQIDAMVILRGEPCEAGKVEVTIHTIEGKCPL